jgi:hypothetical protein
MTTLRNRLVTEQDGREHVSSVLLAPDEIPYMLETEEHMHTITGWNVTRHGAMLRCQRGPTIRWIWVRSRKPQDDTL